MNTIVMNGMERGTARGAGGLPAEESLEIRLNGRSVAVTMRTPGEDFELAAGFLFGEGMIRGLEEVRSMDRLSDDCENVVAIELESAPAPAAVESLPLDDSEVPAEIFNCLAEKLRRQQSLFEGAEGLHAAALFNLRGELEGMREDVGPHNALDKLVGLALLGRRAPLNDGILLVSGRASLQLVRKALAAGVRIMAAAGAPTSMAVAAAERAGMTLIGFLKSGTFKVYTGSGRVSGLACG